MLRQLHISGLGVIDDLDLEPAAGLTVLTGETGAGKTMIAVALSLVTGSRASSQLARAGATAKIQARFDAPEGSETWAEDGEILLARTVGSDGKSGARIGGQLATASALAEVGARLVEIHGQHGSLRLLEPLTQIDFVDRAAGPLHLGAIAAYREAYGRLVEIRAAVADLEDATRERERELDLLAYQVREIEAVSPRAGETSELEAEAARLGHVERLLELGHAAEVSVADDGGAAESLGAAARQLAEMAELDPSTAELAERASGLAAEAAELGRDVRRRLDSLTIDPERLEEVRGRIAALKGLQRKYGATDSDVVAFVREASERLAALSGADERLEELRSERDALEERATASAAEVSAGRSAVAPDLGRDLTRQIEELGMEGAAVRVHVEPLAQPGPAGADRVELLVRGGSDQADLPLAKTASGGELSRVMLACRSILADLDDVPTLVFDEVDAGIGGRAGLAVGRRLAALAATRQVLVVTHLPQIACFADQHVRVRKDHGVARIDVLEDSERIRELSRMLAGLESSAHGASHAEELLAEAARVRAGA
ncbi:MAG TPA: DNA repair protein RecN [Actinomycetota bacterium]|nr:DNA repair protein RecN [Actinomycetota bacterium]